jgi:hypothetical protein
VTLVVHEAFADQLERILFDAHQRFKRWSGGRRDRYVDPDQPEWAAAVIDLVLAQSPLVEWLDRDSGIFTLDPEVTRNRIVTPIQKIVAVAGQIEATSLRTALLRSYRYRGMPYSSRHLLELCRRISGLAVAGTAVRNVSLDAASLLGPEEVHLWELLRSRGTPLSRPEIHDGARRSDISDSTVIAALTYSIIIQRTADGQYALIGTANEPPMDGTSLWTRPGRELCSLGKGRLPDGRIWLSYRASTSVLQTGSFPLPSTYFEELRGQIALKPVEDGPTYWGRMDGHFAWFGEPFITGAPIELGDGVLLIIDPAHGEGVYLIGNSTDMAERAEGGDWDSLLAIETRESDLAAA